MTLIISNRKEFSVSSMKTQIRKLIWSAIAFCGLLLADQYTKRLAALHLKGRPPFVLIDRVLEFSYLENTGAAFSSFSGMQTFLIILTTLVIFVLAWRYFTLPAGRRFVWIRLCLLFILCGAVGNLIDRVLRHYVVDFIYFVPINFPKFNVADIYITVGVFVLAALMLFYYSDEECGALLSIDTFFKK